MKFDLNGEDKPEYVVSSDTDSLFVNIGKILKHTHPNLDINNKDECLPIVRQYQKEIGTKLNNQQTIIAKNILNADEHFFDLKPEYILKKAYWSGKRRYAQHMVDKEGMEIDKFVMMGLDIMKSNFPKYFRNFGEELIKKILLNTPKNEIDKYVMNFKKSIGEVEWKKLLKPVGIKKLDEYIESPPKTGEIFSKLKLKCPVNTKAAIQSNDLIRFKKLQKEYPEFTVGDKLYMAMLKPNPYKIDVVALNGYNDPPFILEIVEKYLDKSGIFDSVMRNKLEGVYKDLGWSLQLNEFVNKFFTFGD